MAAAPQPQPAAVACPPLLLTPGEEGSAEHLPTTTQGPPLHPGRALGRDRPIGRMSSLGPSGSPSQPPARLPVAAPRLTPHPAAAGAAAHPALPRRPRPGSPQHQGSLRGPPVLDASAPPATEAALPPSAPSRRAPPSPACAVRLRRRRRGQGDRRPFRAGAQGPAGGLFRRRVSPPAGAHARAGGAGVPCLRPLPGARAGAER